MNPTQEAITKAIEAGLEVCICAAIQYQGRVWRGHRHGHCMEAMKQELSWTMTGKEMMNAQMFREQGFVTNRNRYVTREEALILHKAAGIPSHAQFVKEGDDYRGSIMFSEDLY